MAHCYPRSRYHLWERCRTKSHPVSPMAFVLVNEVQVKSGCCSSPIRSERRVRLLSHTRLCVQHLLRLGTEDFPKDADRTPCRHEPDHDVEDRYYDKSEHAVSVGHGICASVLRGPQLLSFEPVSISCFVRSTSPKICVHPDTMFPTTCPHFPATFMWTNRASHAASVTSRKIVSECSRNASTTRFHRILGGLLSAEPFS